MKKEGDEINHEELKTPDLMTNLLSRIENSAKPPGGGDDDAWNHWED